MPEDAPVNTGAVAWPDPFTASVMVREMQIKLHRWAGGDPSRRFGDLCVPGRKPAGDSGVGQPIRDVLAGQAGPVEQPTGVVGEGGKRPLTAIAHSGEPIGAVVDDGGEVGGAAAAGLRCRDRSR